MTKEQYDEYFDKLNDRFWAKHMPRLVDGTYSRRHSSEHRIAVYEQMIRDLKELNAVYDSENKGK